MLAINTRAVATTPPDQPRNPATVLTDLSDAFAAVGHTGYQLTTTHYPTDSDAANQLAADLSERTLRDRKQGSRLPAALPVVGPTLNTQNPQIVAAPDTAGAFAAVGGASLPEPARRAIQTKSRDSVPRPLLPTGVLDHCRTAGFRFGRPQSYCSSTVGDPLAVPPSLQRRHLAILGQTGWGMGMLAITGLLHNHAATDGATIILETKDGQFADDYLCAHYSTYDTLADVYRFDAHERLPAAPIFDIGPAIASGLSLTQAVQAVTNQLEAMLQGVMGPRPTSQSPRQVASSAPS